MDCSESVRRLCALLRAHDLSALEHALSAERFSPDDLGAAAFLYVDECGFEMMDASLSTPNSSGSVNPDFPSFQMPRKLALLLKAGMNPNQIVHEAQDEDNLMYELRYIDNGYIAADSLAVLLEHNGNPWLSLNGEPLAEQVGFDVAFDLQEQKNPQMLDALIHYWMVLLGFCDKEKHDFVPFLHCCPGFDTALLRNHRNYDYSIIRTSYCNPVLVIRERAAGKKVAWY